MPIFRNVGGTWKKVKTLWANNKGTPTKVRRAFVNVGGTWKQMYANNDFTVYALGLAQTLTAAANRGLWANGKQLYVAARSYNVYTLDSYGNVLAARSFDVFGDVAAANTNNSAAMTSYLNSLAVGTPILVVSYDEPDGGRTAALESAMYRCGATSGIFGVAKMNYRSAYLLMGYVGGAAVVELNVGSDVKDSSGNSVGAPNSAIAYTFNFTEGTFSNVTRTI